MGTFEDKNVEVVLARRFIKVTSKMAIHKRNIIVCFAIISCLIVRPLIFSPSTVSLYVCDLEEQEELVEDLTRLLRVHEIDISYRSCTWTAADQVPMMKYPSSIPMKYPNTHQVLLIHHCTVEFRTPKRYWML